MSAESAEFWLNVETERDRQILAAMKEVRNHIAGAEIAFVRDMDLVGNPVFDKGVQMVIRARELIEEVIKIAEPTV